MKAKYISVALVVTAAVLAGPALTAAPPASGKSAILLAPLRANDVNAFVRELPGENLGDGGEFSVGRNRYVRLEGRHLTFRTPAGVKTCVVNAAAAKSWTFDSAGTVGCADVRLTIAVNNRVQSDLGQPVILTVAQGTRVSKMNGLWQGLD